MTFFDKIPNCIGYLILTEDGAVQSSGGELENDERSANIIMEMIRTEGMQVLIPADATDDFQRISIVFDHHSYIITMSNKRIYVAKRKNTNSLEPTNHDVQLNTNNALA